MKIGKRIGSETYADFTLSRVPKNIRDSLTDEQYQAVRAALIAREQSARHSIDMRLSIPLFFRSYYFVFFAGRDRRATTYWLEDSRWQKIPKPIRRAFHYLFSFSLSIAILSVVFMLSYKLKSLFGINFFSEFHLYDLFTSVWPISSYNVG